ncbi:hypothetical protein [Paracerasibacillus soli]|uniref:Uncharacterized protein n=1 Tax=Paracerasibacillus soli TaxID=480284 RepID=A0ABU5CPI3_9BACI|nr:hypothetical protein [Virgibacillus soli]MDY0408273.1 hypothetical protein [Virgibacillus soli]
MRYVWTGVLKLIVTPIGILVSSWIFPNVYFSRWYQPILLGIVAAIIGYMLEIVMLRKDTNILSTLLDFLVTAAIVYFGAIIFLGTSVTFWVLF